MYNSQQVHFGFERAHLVPCSVSEIDVTSMHNQGPTELTGGHRPLAGTFRSAAARSLEGIATAYIEGDTDEVQHQLEAPAQAERPAELEAPESQQDREPIDRSSDLEGGGKSSSVRVPARCYAKLEELRASTGMTNGQIFIVAIEATHDRLPELLYPGGRIGGGLFAARGIRAKTSRDDNETQVTYRLFHADFDVIDHLVAELGAKSRSHLIAAALTGYFFKDDELGT
ncbi:hypothetical protein ACKAMS_30595 [Rhodococcus sp. 5A-K4]|uniref:hypothetical protein n=1 Tax=Rhodococcus TaxID=1827 RepID=UPI001EE935B2